ncbi:MAG TPA: DUF721 domain-containing protein, partial [Desulfobacteraceae bacterium]|nr:DUF721 domain-containing protein [Desulfobacteraceae bacterium]
MESKRTKNNELLHVGGIIEKILNRFNHEPDKELKKVWSVWNDVMEKSIAENARPAAFKGDILLLNVNSSAWMHQLQFFKENIIEKLNNSFGKKLVKDIKFKIG